MPQQVSVAAGSKLPFVRRIAVAARPHRLFMDGNGCVLRPDEREAYAGDRHRRGTQPPETAARRTPRQALQVPARRLSR